MSWLDPAGWLGRIARARRVPLALFFASILESTFVPLPIELLMTPLMVANRPRAFTFAAAVFAGCLVGCAIMYGVGALAYQTVGLALLDAFGWGAADESFRAASATHGVLAVALISLTPVPLVVGAIGAGAAGMNVFVFLAVIAATRAVRYFGIALLVHLLGPRAEALLARYRESGRVRAATWGGTAVLAAALVAVALVTLPGAEP